MLEIFSLLVSLHLFLTLQRFIYVQSQCICTDRKPNRKKRRYFLKTPSSPLIVPAKTKIKNCSACPASLKHIDQDTVKEIIWL